MYQMENEYGKLFFLRCCSVEWWWTVVFALYCRVDSNLVRGSRKIAFKIYSFDGIFSSFFLLFCLFIHVFCHCQLICINSNWICLLQLYTNDICVVVEIWLVLWAIELMFIQIYMLIHFVITGPPYYVHRCIGISDCSAILLAAHCIYKE